MGKEWDKALPSKDIWLECLRVLKPGAFAFVMCTPRADCLWRMIRDLELTGFIVRFSPMLWTYSSGFPKACDIGKAIDKKLGKKRKIVGYKPVAYPDSNNWGNSFSDKAGGISKGLIFGDGSRRGSRTPIEEPVSKKARELDGSYGGFQPKPAVEAVIVAMKPLSEKSYVEQALKNKKGITWLGDCRIPTDWSEYPDSWKESGHRANPTESMYGCGGTGVKTDKGRFPANLLVSDDILNDGKITKSAVTIQTKFVSKNVRGFQSNPIVIPGHNAHGDSGSYSRYFDIDVWFQEKLKQRLGNKFKGAARTFPFLLSTKAGKQERWFYCRVCKSTQEVSKEKEHYEHICWCKNCEEIISRKKMEKCRNNKHKLVFNLIYHPTVKPLKLMTYLVTLGSREGDKVLDPFAGTCKTAMACEILKRNYLMIDSDAIALELGRAGIRAINNPPLRKKLLKGIEE